MRIALAIGVLAAAIALVAPALSASRPTVRVVARRPLTIVGSGFRASEQIRLTAVAAGRHIRSVRATARGRFRVRFRHVRLRRCSFYLVTAQGNMSSFAVARGRSACRSRSS